MIEDVFKSTIIDSSKLTEYLDDFIIANSQKSYQTLVTYKHALKKFILYHSKTNNFTFQVDDFKKFKKYLESKKEMSEVSVRTYITALRRFIDFIVKSGGLEKNPVKRIHCNASTNGKTFAFLSKSDIKSLTNSIEKDCLTGLRDCAMIQLILCAALSENEIINLNIENLRHFRKKWFIEVFHKSSAEPEKILISNEIADAINSYLGKRTKPLPERPLFISLSNRSLKQRLSSRGLKEALMKRLTASGIKKKNLTPNIIFITSGFYLTEKGKSIEDIMMRLRIKHKPTALRYYEMLNTFLNG